jgi:hypothetical protein
VSLHSLERGPPKHRGSTGRDEAPAHICFASASSAFHLSLISLLMSVFDASGLSRLTCAGAVSHPRGRPPRVRLSAAHE